MQTTAVVGFTPLRVTAVTDAFLSGWQTSITTTSSQSETHRSFLSSDMPDEKANSSCSAFHPCCSDLAFPKRLIKQ